MDSLAGISAAILAGGFGTRLRPAVSDRPKVLADVNGKPFLSYLLDQLAESGIRKVVLCTGYMADMVRLFFGATYRNLEISYSIEKIPLGTGGALRLALPLLKSDPVLVLNGDSCLKGADLLEFAVRHGISSAEASLLLTHVDDISRYGSVTISHDNTVKSFNEKGDIDNGTINAGIYLLNRTVIESIPVGCECSLEREIFPALLGKGLHGFVQQGSFIDIGIPSSYAAASDFFGT